MSEEVWYRPMGTIAPGRRVSSQFHLWYRESPTGYPETTESGAITWRRTVPSVEFGSMNAVRTSGICIRVSQVGDYGCLDPDLAVDEGL